MHRHRNAGGQPAEGRNAPALFLVLLAPHAQHIAPHVTGVISVRKPAPAERSGEPAQLLSGRAAPPVNQPAEGPRDLVNVLRRLHPALDLEGRHAHFAQLRDIRRQGEILQGERIIGSLPPVRQAAGLGALAAVSAPAADQRGEQALPGMADAQRPVDEQLGFDRRLRQERLQVLPADLPCRHHAGHTARAKLPCHRTVVPRHLRAGVQLHRRHHPPQSLRPADIGNNQGIHPRPRRIRRRTEKLRHLAVGNQGVQRQIDPHPARVREANRLAQLPRIKILRVRPGIEGHAAQIYSISPAFQCRFQRRDGTCGA